MEKKATKAHIKRGAAFLKKIRNLQSDIYYFQESLEDYGLTKCAQKAGQSGFELDTCASEMAYCVKMLQASNYGPQ